jgi:hypothetical protein
MLTGRRLAGQQRRIIRHAPLFGHATRTRRFVAAAVVHTHTDAKGELLVLHWGGRDSSLHTEASAYVVQRSPQVDS